MLNGDAAGAFGPADRLPISILLTRSLGKARDWLKKESRGHRRYGLLADSGARRLRAEGLGVLLSAADGSAIAHWYLNPVGDIRSSFALEVPANEYTSQGLVIDFATVCWGGDMLYDSTVDRWRYSSSEGRVGRRLTVRSVSALSRTLTACYLQEPERAWSSGFPRQCRGRYEESRGIGCNGSFSSGVWRSLLDST